MSIDFFEHNAKAYNAAVSMLSETGKAAIIHPIGSGISFLGVKNSTGDISINMQKSA